MKFFGYKIKSGFSLTEISIALLIVGILVAVTIPVVRKQLTKSDEYSYYLAFKTVEDLAAQVALNPVPDNPNQANNTNSFFQKAYAQDYPLVENAIFNYNMPTNNNVPFYLYVMTLSEPFYLLNVNTSNTGYPTTNFNVCTSGHLLSYIKNAVLPSFVQSDDPDCSSSTGSEYTIKVAIPLGYANAPSYTAGTITTPETIPYTSGLNYICDPGKIRGSSECIDIQNLDFNVKTRTYCSANQYYDASSGQCKNNNSATSTMVCPPATTEVRSGGVVVGCTPNISPVTAKRFCEIIEDKYNVKDSKCDNFKTSGTNHYNEKLYKAVTTTKTESDGTTSTTINSLGIILEDGTQYDFDKITPNITFANGMRMWILGDRAASIPGLTSSTNNVSETINMCAVDNTKITEESCLDSGEGTAQHFCGIEKKCVTLNQNAGNSSYRMPNASLCCSSGNKFIPEGYTEEHADNPIEYAISGFTVYVDIDGSKGENKLWSDIYPFYIGSNGRVYPGYPLDAQHEDLANGIEEEASVYFGGNSDVFLPTDVYYYDVEDSKRVKKYAKTGISYAQALCYSGQIDIRTPYCMNLGTKMTETDLKRNSKKEAGSYNVCLGNEEHPAKKCFISLRKKHMFF